MSLILNKPQSRIEEIVYQTILPYYSEDILEKYESVAPGLGQKILDSLNSEVYHLENSKAQWIEFGDIKSWEPHLEACGYNVSKRFFID